MGKKEHQHPPCLAAICKSSEPHRREWELLCDSSSSCTTALTAGFKDPKPETLRSCSASRQTWTAAHKFQSAWSTFKEHLLTAGNNNKSHIITLLEGMNTFFPPLFYFFSIFFIVFKSLCLDQGQFLLLVTQSPTALCQELRFSPRAVPVSAHTDKCVYGLQCKILMCLKVRLHPC